MVNRFIYQGQPYYMAACPRCSVMHAFDEPTYQTALARREAFSVSCPNGHQWTFRTGETEEQKLRLERDRLKQQLAQKDDEIAFERSIRQSVERTASARKGQITKMKNRAAAGICPCCNRSFENLRRHMSNKHPQFAADEIV